MCTRTIRKLRHRRFHYVWVNPKTWQPEPARRGLRRRSPRLKVETYDAGVAIVRDGYVDATGVKPPPWRSAMPEGTYRFDSVEGSSIVSVDDNGWAREVTP